MQIGVTIPLQKQLKLPKMSYGDPEDLFFCWEAHRIKYDGKQTLLVVNANNRLCAIMTNIPRGRWKDLVSLAEEGIEEVMKSEGYSKEEIDAYFNRADVSVLTKTHGRKPVAGLNRIVEDMYFYTKELDSTAIFQEEISRKANATICSPSGFETMGIPSDFFREDMKRTGIRGINES